MKNKKNIIVHMFQHFRDVIMARTHRGIIKTINQSKQNIVEYAKRCDNAISEIKQQQIAYAQILDSLKRDIVQNVTQSVNNTHKILVDMKNRMQNMQYELILTKLREKLRNGQKIRICFSVVFDGVFPAAPIFEKFANDKNFEAFILVIPDVLRGEEHMFKQMNQTYDVLSKKYKNVYKSYDEKTKSFVDWRDKMDLCFFANPYDPMTHEYYRITSAINSNILTLFTNYGYLISNVNMGMFNQDSFQKLWKIFLLDKHEMDLLQNNDNNGSNGVLVGYCKLDKLAQIKEKKRACKKIIIAPHHTVAHWENGLELSNFVRYADFFLDLFKKYPGIDFVFRPHPLMWINLQNNNIWTKKQIDDYLNTISKMPNVEYQNGGDYFETFVNSDALIHDCGSFTAEYLFVNKPCCYLLKNQEMLDKNSNEFHKQCIGLHYPAYNEQDIIDFIENIVIHGKDTKSVERQQFVQNELFFKHPNVSQSIYEYIKKELGI